LSKLPSSSTKAKLVEKKLSLEGLRFFNFFRNLSNNNWTSTVKISAGWSKQQYKCPKEPIKGKCSFKTFLFR